MATDLAAVRLGTVDPPARPAKDIGGLLYAKAADSADRADYIDNFKRRFWQTKMSGGCAVAE